MKARILIILIDVEKKRSLERSSINVGFDKQRYCGSPRQLAEESHHRPAAAMQPLAKIWWTSGHHAFRAVFFVAEVVA
jgi:hypothetical protein